jgi:hypothetical protein
LDLYSLLTFYLQLLYYVNFVIKKIENNIFEQNFNDCKTFIVLTTGEASSNDDSSAGRLPSVRNSLKLWRRKTLKIFRRPLEDVAWTVRVILTLTVSRFCSSNAEKVTKQKKNPLLINLRPAKEKFQSTFITKRIGAFLERILLLTIRIRLFHYSILHSENKMVL